MPEMLNVSYKRRAIRAAKELRYGKKVVDKLKKATSDNEITRIMYSARNAEWSGKERYNNIKYKVVNDISKEEES